VEGIDMGWNNGSATHGLKAIDTYADAQIKYNTTKEIRGSANVRPLGDRRYGHTANIVSSSPEDTNPDYYAAKLYNTECIKWLRPDDGIERVIVSVDKWPTKTTCMFLDRTMPYKLGAVLSRFTVRVNGWPVPRQGSLTLEFREDKWQATDAQVEIVHKINRTKANEVRRTFKDFRNWLHGMLSLREGKFEEIDPRMPIFSVTATALDLTTVIAFMLAPDSDPEKYVKYDKVMMWGVLNYGNTKYINNGGMLGGGYKYTRFFTMKQFDLMLMKLHAKDVLIVEELPYGVVKTDAYAKWL
jgi:hypothetical protein